MLSSLAVRRGSRVLLSSLLLLLLAVASAPAEAQGRQFGRSVLGFSGSVNFVTDYIFRGESRTNGQQTVQADLGMDLNFYGRLRVGLWGSGIAGASAEIREYIRYTLPLPLVSLHFGATRYRFPGAVNRSNTLGQQDEGVQTDEIFAGATLSLAQLLRLDATLYEESRGSGSSNYTEISARLPFGFTFAYGSGGSDSDDANISLAYSFNLNRVTVSMTYYESRSEFSTSDIDDIWRTLRDSSYEDEDLVLSISARF